MKKIAGVLLGLSLIFGAAVYAQGTTENKAVKKETTKDKGKQEEKSKGKGQSGKKNEKKKAEQPKAQ